ncbi:MAG: TonB-dependent siderophore receptor [Pyrinomonadaceae bacterium]
MKQFLKFSLLAILFSTSAATLSASHRDTRNETKVVVAGRVADQNDAGIPGAVIRFAGVGPSAEQTVTTDANGTFVVSLEAGEYDVTVRAEGFSEFTKRVLLKPFESASVNVALQILPSTVTVDVVSSGEYQADSTTTATKTLTPLRDVPQSVSVVTERQIADQLLTNVGDTVRYVAGITALQGENNRDQVNIRGQNSSADFFLNGVRDDVQYYRDLYNLESMEIVRGPNALIFGRGGGGGIINRVSKEAVLAPFYAFNIQGGSFGHVRGTFDLNKDLTRKLAVRFNGLAERAGSFRDFVKRDRFGFTPTLTFSPDFNTRFTLTYEYLRDRRVADRGITSFAGRPADVDRSTYYGNPDDSRVRSNVDLLHGSFERQFGKLNLRNRTMFGDYDSFYQNYVPGAANAARTLVALTAYNNHTKRRNLFNQTDLTYIVNTGRIRHTLLGGVELGRQRTNNVRHTGYFNNTATSLQVAFDHPVTRVPVTYRQSATDADNRVLVGLGAAYIQDQVEINRYLHLVGGVRLDYFDLKFHNNRSGEDLRRIDRLVSPRFGAVVKPVQEVSLYGSYSVSYLPSSGDQFSSLTTITQQVKPEKFENLEAGVKWDIRRNLALTSAIYRLDRTNTRSTDPNDPTRIIQTGAQRTNGFEFGLGGQLTRDWSFTGGYSYQDAFILRATTAAAAGKKAAQVPHHSFSMWNKYHIIPKLAAGFGIVARSEMFAGVDNTVVLPGYVRADAAVFYTISENWKLQANIENVFNTRYYLNAHSNTNISPGAPTAVKLALTARF